MKCPTHGSWLASCHCILEGKGEKGKRCNRQGCQEEGATWYNRIMRAWYCPACAIRINASSLPHDPEPLCKEDETL